LVVTADGTWNAGHSRVRGSITGREVIFHSVTILRLWGPSMYLRCLHAVVTGRSCTFLGLLAAGTERRRAA
jgi:hypothetical protein